ncbi:hypothetical protein DY000_02061503 [Brassica cretica]|uniref:Fatty acyl-CoA reductase n=1 Tax=Brassica cretica TaxID=69181 RepID=A0ABQ7AP16_BRACR|nr:hypothetical protein DY000_02061503 [Brassica cretica]
MENTTPLQRQDSKSQLKGGRRTTPQWQQPQTQNDEELRREPPDVTLPGAKLRIRRETNLQDVKHIGVERDERIGSKDKNQEGGREKLPVTTEKPTTGAEQSAPLILAYAKDHIPHFLGDYQSYFELIPVDLVVNATIAAMSKHGRGNVPESNFTMSLQNLIQTPCDLAS